MYEPKLGGVVYVGAGKAPEDAQKASFLEVQAHRGSINVVAVSAEQDGMSLEQGMGCLADMSSHFDAFAIYDMEPEKRDRVLVAVLNAIDAGLSIGQLYVRTEEGYLPVELQVEHVPYGTFPEGV